MHISNRPAQCTVTDADPVTPVLPRRIVLTLDSSIDHTFVMLPCLSPTVITIRLVP